MSAGPFPFDEESPSWEHIQDPDLPSDKPPPKCTNKDCIALSSGQKCECCTDFPICSPGCGIKNFCVKVTCSNCGKLISRAKPNQG